MLLKVIEQDVENLKSWKIHWYSLLLSVFTDASILVYNVRMWENRTTGFMWR